MASFSPHLLELRLSGHGPRRVPAEGKFTQTQAEGNFSSSFYCSRSTNIILDSLSKYYVFFRNMRIFLLLGTQKPDRPKRELGCLYKKPGRIPNPCRRIPNPPVSVLFSIRTFMRKALSQNFLIQSVPSCSGCSACLNSCPAHSIVMREDGGGFRYPHIDESSCIGCRKCIKVCPVFNGEARGCSSTGADHEPAAYGGWNLDDEVRLASSSGGVFSALPCPFWRRGEPCTGRPWGRISAYAMFVWMMPGQLFRLRGSKYRQSDIGTVYQSVRQDLKAGIPVLFSGVPCQIGGLLSFLGGRHELLLTVDIVCHGVPSDHLFEAYVKWQEANYGSR